MPSAPLTKQEIKELNQLLRKAFEFIEKLRNQNPLAKHIKYPQLPQKLTESLTLHLLKKKLVLRELHGFKFNSGGKKADILATNNGEEKKIEVKATAKNGFQQLTKKDISSDYIVWIHFGEFFMNSEDKLIEILIVRKPRRFFENPRKLKLDKVKEIVGKDLKKRNFDVNSL